MNTSIALVAIGRRENQYAREWVQHHLAVGFDHIYIYDNNHDGEDRFDTVLGDFVAETANSAPAGSPSGNPVTIIPYRNRSGASTQRDAYNDAYARFARHHDWLAFFDFDEFLCLTPSASPSSIAGDSIAVPATMRDRSRSCIKPFLATIPASYNCVLINWLTMTDSGLVHNDHRPLMTRFTVPMPTDKKGIAGNFPENNHVKCIVRGGLPAVKFLRNPHVPTTPTLRCCNANAQPVAQKPRIPYTHDVAYLKHFTTKTIEEFLTNKMQRGLPDRTYEESLASLKDYFFKINDRTPEKEAYVKEYNARNGHVAAIALGRLGNQMFIACAARKLARDTGREFVGLVYNDTSQKPRSWDYPDDQFPTVMRHLKYIEPADVATYYRMERGQYLCNGLPADLPQPDILLNDYFQDARCIDRDDALRLFAPQPEVLAAINRLYGDLSDCVCVNVRRGDYLDHQRFGFRVLTAAEIQEMLDLYFPAADYPRVLFVSDDIPWCRQNFTSPRFLFADRHKHPFSAGSGSAAAPAVPAASPSISAVSGSPADKATVSDRSRSEIWPPLIDLYLQTLCRANIISNSSFSWWGAYLNTHAERVVAPWPWFSPNSRKPDMPHILPDHWIKHRSNNYTIWITYHNDALLAEYHLHEDAHHRLFPVHRDAPLENINYLNPCWSELTTMWYVWHNRLASPLVGFAHYRRPLNVPATVPAASPAVQTVPAASPAVITPSVPGGSPAEKSALPQKGQCLIYKQIRLRTGETIRDQYARCHNVADFDLMLRLINRRYGPDNPYTRHLTTSTRMITNCCFLMPWSDFLALGDFLFPLLDDFAAATGCRRDVALWRKKARRDFPTADDQTVVYQMRLPGFLAERLISAYITTHLAYYK